MGTYSDLVQTSPSPTLKKEKKDTSDKRTSERSLDGTNDGSKQRTMEPTNEPSSERTKPRTVIRHSFDIFADQLQTLRQYKLEGVLTGNQDTKIGEMIREALDDYFAKEGVRTKDRNIVRSIKRS